MVRQGKGWHNQSHNHKLASKGIKSKTVKPTLKQQNTLINDVKFSYKQIYSIINTEVGPNSSREITTEILNIQNRGGTISYKDIEHIVSKYWGPTITSRITKKFKETF